MAALGRILIAADQPEKRVPDARQEVPDAPWLLVVVAMFQALEITAHELGFPGAIVDQSRNVVPVGGGTSDGDHRIVDRATADAGRARIKDARPVTIFIWAGE